MSEQLQSLKSKASGDKELGPLVIVNPKRLAEEGRTGIVAEGLFEGAIQKPAGISSNGKKYKASVEYRVRDLATDTLYIINDTKALKDQLGQLAADGSDKTNVQIVYNGKITTASGNGFHDFEVFVKTA